MQYDSIIIGAGSGGLAAALKLSESGKRVLVLERQNIPGGFASSFMRKGFTFESSVHCVDGLCSGSEIRDFLEATGVDKKIEFIALKDFSRIIYPEHDFVADFSREHFLDSLKKSFPDEAQNLDKFFHELDIFFVQFDIFAAAPDVSWIKFLTVLVRSPKVIQAAQSTISQFLGKYLYDEKLKSIIANLWYFFGLAPSRLSALYFLLGFRGYYFEKTAYVRGGFTRLFESMVTKIRENGSEVRYDATVTKIITQRSKRVQAVLTDKGEVFAAKSIISNANAQNTLTELIDDELLKNKYCKQLSSLEKSLSAFQVYLGLSIPPKALGMTNFMFSVNETYDHDKNFSYCLEQDYEHCPFEMVDHSQIDSSLAPNGKGTLSIITFDAYENWENLNDGEYKKKKLVLADILIKRAQHYLPGLSDVIEVKEIATPRTMHRYTLSPRGAIYGFAQTVEQSGINRLSQETKLKGLFLAGAWTQPGAGVHACLLSGLDAADLALKFLR